MADATPALSTLLWRRLAAVPLVLVGLGGELFAAWLLLAAANPIGLELHLLAAMLWALGMLLTQDPLAEDPSWRSSQVRLVAAELSGWMVAALTLGVLLLPGFGTFACTAAFGLSALLRKRPVLPRGSSLLDSVKFRAIAARPTGTPSRDVQPLVDVLREQNTELRRTVIKLLGDQGDRESVQLLRGLLIDANPDVRSDAAVTLTRLEKEYNAELARATEQLGTHPQDLELRLRLAELSYRYAANGILDSTSAEQYLLQARTLLQLVSQVLPYRADIWVALAQVHRDLGETAAARHALDEALARQPGRVDAYLLAVELAFQSQRWDHLAALMRQPVPVPAQTRDLLSWWQSALPAERQE